MRLIIKIAKNELRSLFYTPVAWFLLILFWVLCSLFYVQRFSRLANSMYNALQEYPHVKYISPATLTAGLVTSPISGMCANILQYLYLFIPLLTMGVISREFNSGSFKLLYTSPLRLRQLVIGKYLGLTIFNLLFLLILAVFMVTASFDIQSVDTGLLVSAAFGIFLLLSSYAAIGFFASSLTRYPIAAALISFVILIVLGNIDQVWQQYSFVRDLTYFLSLKNRTNRILNGLLTTKDIIYFLVIIAMFIVFTLFVLKGKMQALPRYLKMGRYLVVIIIALGIGYISSRQSLTGYLDLSARQTNTLHPNTRQNLDLLRGAPLEVTLYTNLFGDPDEARYAYIGFPVNINSYLDLWEPYRRFKKDIRFKYVYYYAVKPGDDNLYRTFPGKSLKQIAGLIARMLKVDSSMFMGPEEISKIVDLQKIDYGVGTKLSWKERSLFIDYFPSQTGESVFTAARSTSEPPFNAAFRRLSGAKMPRIGFITGQLERSVLKTGEREYSWLNSLYALGFDGDTLNLATQEIPANMTMLMLADPKEALSPVVTGKLEKYIDNGGNMLVLGEPGKQGILNPLLQKMGVQMLPGQLVQPSQHETAEKISAYKTQYSYLLAKEYENLGLLNFMKYVGKGLPKGDTNYKVFTGVAALSYQQNNGYTIDPLWTIKPGKSWRKMDKLVLDSIAPVFNPLLGDVKDSSAPIAIQLARPLNGKEQRMIIVGDADFLSILRVTLIGYDFPRSLFSWLSYNHYPVYTPFPIPKDNILLMTPAWAKLEKLLYTWVIPSILLLMGIVLLTRRKRK
ncbi:Gldg family protein [Niabella sp. CJ426]|uniref:Gldg family protein n=1 Tax=Niabella sp. CJ426 TaxID=3393740 RepID=UPI003D062C10